MAAVPTPKQEKKGPTDGTMCPWCGRWTLKDQACNHVVCGVDTARGFVHEHGCGHQFCFQCGKKLCGQMYDPETGRFLAQASSHSAICCPAEAGFSREEYCPAGTTLTPPPGGKKARTVSQARR